MTKSARSVLILGGRSPVALDHARRFAAQGWRVIVGDSVPCRLSAWSRAVHACVALPSARFALQAYATALNDVITAYRIALVVPTCEEVFYLSRCRSRLPSHVRILADDLNKLAALHSKWHFLDIARQCGMRAPASQRVTDLDQAREWAAGRAVVLKPEFSRFGVRVRMHANGIPAGASPLAPNGAWVAQAYCHGDELCSYSVVERGRVQAHVSYRPSYRIRTSASYVFEPCVMPAIRAQVEALAAHMDFTGQLALDWINADDGLHVLECNPRATSGIHLFAPTDALPAALMGEHDGCVMPADPRPRMLGAVMLIAGPWAALRHGAARRWWTDLRAASDVIVSRGDHLPLPGGLLDLASYARIALQQRCSMRQAVTRDMLWDGDTLDLP